MDGDLALLLLELGALFAGLSLLGLLARALDLSPIPFYLLAGLFFGEGGVVPLAAAEPFVDVGAQIGVLLLLLTLGLEFSAAELVASLRRHRASGVLDLLLNAPPGVVAGLLLGMPWPAAFALGGVTWISSSVMVARLVHDLGRLANRETSSVLSILVIEDIAMALYLPVLVVVLAGGGPWQAVLGAVLALGAVVLALLAAHRGGTRVGRFLAHDDDELLLLRLIGLALLVAGVTEGLGASAGVGAFLVGLAVPPALADRARSLLGPLRDLFAAIFFIAVGLAVDPGELPPVLPAAVALAAVTTVTKVVTGWRAAAREGVRRRGRLRAGATLVARGEFSVVIAGLALPVAPEIGPLAAAYVLVLAVAGPVLARYAEPIGERLGLFGPPGAAAPRPRTPPSGERPGAPPPGGTPGESP